MIGGGPGGGLHCYGNYGILAALTDGWAVDDQELHALKTTSRRWRNWYSDKKEHHRVTVQRDKFQGRSVVGLTHNSQGSNVEVYEKAASPGAD